MDRILTRRRADLQTRLDDVLRIAHDPTDPSSESTRQDRRDGRTRTFLEIGRPAQRMLEPFVYIVLKFDQMLIA